MTASSLVPADVSLRLVLRFVAGLLVHENADFLSHQEGLYYAGGRHRAGRNVLHWRSP